MAPTLKQSASADTSALVVDGNTPTTVAGDDYGHLSSKALKRLCTERGLAVRGDHAALVGRLRAGKKAGPKSSKERMAKSRNNRTEDRSVADRALNMEQVSAHRATRSQAKVVADRARDAGRKEQARANRTEEQVVEDRAINTAQRKELRKNRPPAQVEEDRERDACRKRAMRVNTNHIADLTRGNVRTPKWKVPGKDFHVDGHTSHPEAAMLLLYLSAGIGWNDECKWCIAFIHVYDRLKVAGDWDRLHRLCSLMFVGLERKIAFNQIAAQPFDTKQLKQATEHQRVNADLPLQLQVLPFEEAFLEWFVREGPACVEALKDESERLDLEEKRAKMEGLIGIKLWSVPHCVLKGQDKNLHELADLEERREVMRNTVGTKLQVPQYWWKNAETGKQCRGTKLWDCTITRAKLSTASDADPCFVMECDDPVDGCDPYNIHYSCVRKYWVKTHTRIRCEVVAADFTTASENDPRFFVSERCADEEDDESDSLCASDSEEPVDFEGVEGCADIDVSDAESESSSEADARVQTEVCGGGWIERNRRLGLQRREQWAKRNDDCLRAGPPQSKDTWFDCESDTPDEGEGPYCSAMRYSDVLRHTLVKDGPVDLFPVDRQLQTHCSETLQDVEKIWCGKSPLHSSRNCECDVSNGDKRTRRRLGVCLRRSRCVCFVTMQSSALLCISRPNA